MRKTKPIPITSLADPALDPYARLSETELLRFHEPWPGLFMAESPKVIERALAAGYRPLSFLCEEGQAGEAERLAAAAECRAEAGGGDGAVPVYLAPSEVLAQLTGFAMTRGMLCAMERKSLPPVETVCQGARRVAVLERIMNPTNVGAIFRSAAALGMDAVLLTHGCSDPLYRRAVRVSMGTVFQIPWTFFPRRGEDAWPEGSMALLRSLGFFTAAMALREDSRSLEDPRLLEKEKLAIVLGSEGDGLAQDTMAACDCTVRIPMCHGVDSLNVAAASAVAFWQLRRRQDGET